MRGAPPPVTATMTSTDGVVLMQFTRRSEHPGDARPDAPPLIVVEVAGDIDAETEPLLHKTLTQTVRGNRRVCCDLGRVGFLGAAAVRTILAAVGEAERAGCDFTVRGLHGFGVRVFQVSGLDAFLASRR
ncbi:STAS domain-containing protein [Actinoplanes sp. RD1]|uniref:STAS domain-containing protein n=1 Tax=Actinoplanes sp. RD1 TaxID=3064538 RepID=UPI0027415EBB|nr:STAS domain-containing protein [Actinoplanes sp. RD1]